MERIDELAERAGAAVREDAQRLAQRAPDIRQVRRRHSRRSATVGVVAVVVSLAAAIVVGPRIPDDTGGLTIDPVAPSEGIDRSPSGSLDELPSDPPAGGAEVVPFDVPMPVALRVVVVDHHSSTRAAIDLARGELVWHPRNVPRQPVDADRALVMSDGTVVMWSDRRVLAYVDGTEGRPLVHEPSDLVANGEVFGQVYVMPTAEADALWIVQPGPCCEDQSAGIAELFDLESGRIELAVEVPANSVPAAATSRGLLLNTLRLFDTGDGWRGEPGSHRSLLLSEGGTLAEFTPGEVFAASASAALVLVCPDHEHQRDCELDLVDIDSGQSQRLQAPVEGSWTSVTQPRIPAIVAGWSPTAPDGRILAGLYVQEGEHVAESHLVVIEPRTGEVTTLKSLDGWPPVAAWDRTGQFVVLHDGSGSDLVVINRDGTPAFTLPDVIPDGHHVVGMR